MTTVGWLEAKHQPPAKPEFRQPRQPAKILPRQRRHWLSFAPSLVFLVHYFSCTCCTAFAFVVVLFDGAHSQALPCVIDNRESQVAPPTLSPGRRLYHVSHSDIPTCPTCRGSAAIIEGRKGHEEGLVPRSGIFIPARCCTAPAPSETMSPNHISSPGLSHPSDSHATHCSLRGGAHPLKQNPPSIVEDTDYSGFDDVDIHDPIRPPPSALTAATTAYDPHSESPSPLENYSAGSRIGGHQKSLTGTFLDNCQPFLNRATSTLQQHTSRASLHSPTKSLASFIPSRSVVETKASQPNFRAGAKALQSWFNGSSAPVNVGIRSHAPGFDDEDSDDYDSEEDEDEDPAMMSSIFNRASSLTGSSTASDTTPTKQSTPTPKSQTQTQTSNASSRFAWLLSTQKNANLPPSVPSPTYHNPSDELLNLNISQALFPHGPVDPLAPSSFNDLLSTAESLLARYQNSYRQLSTTVNDLHAEQSAQDDELDESETRVRHLKMQLETMAARASEQDAQMQRLMEELTFERKARQEEEAARKRSLALIRSSPAGYPVEEAGQSPRMRRNRVSNSDVSVDSGFESECESDAASIFSRTNCLSPTDTVHSSAAPSICEHEAQNDTTPKNKLQRPQQVQRRSTYDKVRDGSIDIQNGGWGCANCEGGSQSAVWGRLAREREESNALRRRVEVLEHAVDGALNVVDGPWGM